MQHRLMPWWELGGEATCLPCLKQIVPDNEEIYGGYPIETDKAPLCPGCGRELDMIYIGHESAWLADAGAVGE